jgi:hypothetical protein
LLRNSRNSLLIFNEKSGKGNIFFKMAAKLRSKKCPAFPDIPSPLIVFFMASYKWNVKYVLGSTVW